MRQEPNSLLFHSETDKLKSDLSRISFQCITEKSAREYDQMLAIYQIQNLQIELDYTKSRLDETRKMLGERDNELLKASQERANHKIQLTRIKQAREKDRKKFVEERAKDQEVVKWLKANNEELTEQVKTLNNGGVVVPKRIQMPICEICAREYSESPLMTPRMLSCGHTVCEECAGMIIGNKTLKCPFDRKITKVKDGVRSLPKNFTIVQMMSRK